MNKLIDISRYALILVGLVMFVPVVAGLVHPPEEPIVYLVYCGFFITVLSVVSSWRKE